jgi:hypothetical protein
MPLVVLVLVLQQAAAPPMLEQALKTLPDVRLLSPASDLKEYTQADLQKLGYWPPWLAGDFDRDTRPDIAAVVVRPARGTTEFGVIAVHAAPPGRIEWVVPLDADPINGVTTGSAPDTVVPLFCVECDSNIWFRWSGDEYETELYAVGEKIDVGTETQADVRLYTSPNLASKPAGSIPHCTTVTVQKVGGVPDKRWYHVETPDGQLGWISAEVTSDDICVG